MTDQPNPTPGSRLDRIEADLDVLLESVALTDEHVRTLVRLHAESREDIARLYAAWPAHLRHNHGDH